jgi:uncharacterized membrane protein
MLMSTRARKFALTTHIMSSVGWFGAVVAFLSLAVAGLTSQNSQTVRAAYLSMELTTWGVIVPFSIASLITGIVQSVGTTWGLFRHYWIVAKLGLTVVATVILLVHTQPIGRVAAVAAERMLSSADLHQLRVQLIADAAAALMALLVATTLSVYKPWGMTSYGRRTQAAAIGLDARLMEASPWPLLWLLGFIIAMALFAALHLASGGLHHH